MRQSCGSFQLPYDWMKRAIRVLRGTEIAQARVRFTNEVLQQRGSEPRFADACLS